MPAILPISRYLDTALTFLYLAGPQRVVYTHGYAYISLKNPPLVGGIPDALYSLVHCVSPRSDPWFTRGFWLALALRGTRLVSLIASRRKCCGLCRHRP